MAGGVSVFVFTYTYRRLHNPRSRDGGNRPLLLTSTRRLPDYMQHVEVGGIT
jgi:hypothetical protein